MRKESYIYGLLIWFITIAIVIGLVGGCSTSQGYSSIECDKHYKYISKAFTVLERESILREVHLRCMDGMPVRQYWDGLDRKWNRQRNTRRL